MKTVLLALLLHNPFHKHHHGPSILWRTEFVSYLIVHASANSECLGGYLADLSKSPEAADGSIWSPACDRRLQEKL